MTDVDSSHCNEEKLNELYDTVWSGYDAGSLNQKATSGPSRSRSNRPLPPTPGSATSSPVSARPHGLDSPDGSILSSRQLPFKPSTYFVQSPTEEAAPHYPFTPPPPPPPPPIANPAYAEDIPAYSPRQSGNNTSFPTDEKSSVQWSSPEASGSGLGVSSPRDQYVDSPLYDPSPSNIAGPSSRPYQQKRTNSDLLHAISAGPQNTPDEVVYEDGRVISEDGGGNPWNGSDVSEDESRFVNYSLLSHLAVQLKDKVTRGTHVKGSIPYPRAFTGKDIVSTIQSLIQRELAINHNISTSDRRAALQVARSLQSQLFFYEVEWGSEALQDGVEDVYMFWDDQEGPSGGEPAELPTGVVTVLTRCYTPDCVDGAPCYSPRCPRRGDSILGPAPAVPEPVQGSLREDWIKAVPKEVLASLPETEINRQTIIHKLISKEEQYIEDLDIIESVFIRPLRQANPPIIAASPSSPIRNSFPSLHAVTPSADSPLDAFIDTVFSNILDLRECNKRLLEVLYVRQREQSPVIQKIGDIFLDAATEFRMAYPIYVGGYMAAEKRLREEAENNVQWKLFVEQCTREVQRHRNMSISNGNDDPSSPNPPSTNFRLDLKHYLNRPIEHLQKYPVLLEAILNETVEGNPDADFLVEAIDAIKALQGVAQMRTFQTSMGRGPAEKWEWFDMVSGGKGGGDMSSKAKELGISKMECKRQSIIFELIKGEMAYVKDLENIGVIYIRPLRDANPPVIPPDRLEQFVTDVFHNYAELFVHHRRLLEKLQEIQREEHPVIRSITAAVFDAALNFRDAYLEYITHYPISEYRIDEELAQNPVFKKFVEDCVRHPEANRLDMKSFINRPIPRLLRYELLLKNVMDETIPGHEDHQDIPQVLEVIKALGKDSEPGVVSAKQKVELWRYNSNIVFKPGEWIDMDLLNENRSLIHTGKLLRQPEGGLNGWSELFVLLFDNYFVMTKCRERDGVTKYYVNRRPIPLDLLTLVNFTDPPTQRGAGLLRNLRGERHNATTSDSSANLLRTGDTSMTTINNNVSGSSNPTGTLVATDSRSVFPCTIHHNGRMGGAYILYAESAQARMEWRIKLEEAMGLRKVVQESNKVFEVETLSTDTFLVPPVIGTNSDGAPWSGDTPFTGKVTCSVPFNTADGRGLVAIGCAEGVWIGFRHDSRSMRRVLHLKMVSQCAMLEDFGIFLVLADKQLFAYHIEALVPSLPSNQHTSQTPQKLSGNKEVYFFSVGTLQGRTLVIYMKKKSMDSIFCAVEPVIDKIKEVTKASAGLGSRFGFRTPKSDWFRPFREFFLPSESYDLIFLKARIAILCSKGFEIMDLSDLQSVTIPQREDPRLSGLIKRCEACRPLGMFRSTDEEFLLCYNEFGLYVNKRGEPSRTNGLIEWEGTAERVALHSPYILLFDIRFIEIRHVQTGRLAQIINGNDVHCLWDGRGAKVAATINSIPGQEDDDRMVQEPRVHGVMNSHDSTRGAGMVFQNGRNNSKAIAQHVFELIPTIPLYLPGSLASPSTPAYFPQSYSPPHSPTLRPVTGFRM